MKADDDGRVARRKGRGRKERWETWREGEAYLMKHDFGVGEGHSHAWFARR